MTQRVTIDDLQQRKHRGEKITMLTAYDYPMAKLLDAAGVDAILVGDSLSMVVLGYDSTTPVTMDEMVHHAKAARRGVDRALLIGDLPAMALQGSASDTVRHATRFVREANCDAVKVEWKEGMDHAAHAMVESGIAVMGHVGLTPQTAAAEGGFGLRGKDAASAARIVSQAEALEQAGCFGMVLECVPDVVAQTITQRLRIPTIGIGSGPSCDGQVVVTYDLLGLFDRFHPSFVKQYANLGAAINQAAGDYIRDVKTGMFPAREHTKTMAASERETFLKLVTPA